MSTYALLQRSLDQTISREAMEEASTAAPMVARGDCARLQRELFGIVVRRLDEENARAFQAALRRYGFETDLVPDEALFALPASFGAIALRLEAGRVAFGDVYGREREAPLTECAFAAAGRVTIEQTRRTTAMELEVRDYGRWGRTLSVVPATRKEAVEALQFRIELYFARDPLRVEWTLEEGRVARLNGWPVRWRDTERLHEFLGELRAALPPDRVNRGLAQFDAAAPLYPNLRCFEEEIIWHFHRLRASRGG